MNDQPDMSKPTSKSVKRHVIVAVGFFALSVMLALGTDEMRELLEQINYLLATTPGFVILFFVCMGGIIYETNPITLISKWKWRLSAAGELIANLVVLIIFSWLLAIVFGVLYRLLVNLLGVIAGGVMLINAPVMVWLHHVLSAHHLREEWRDVKGAIDLAKDKK